MSFASLGLSEEILRAIADQGYTEPTPIQAQAIPSVLEGRDLMGGAQTGTGKTAAFTLPMLQKLRMHANTSPSPARHPIRALIVTPTRELAQQVFESVRTYSKYLPLRSAVVYGGVSIDPQIKDLHAGVEILVATPGRLLDHVHQRTVGFQKVEFLVLDEADRMLDMGFMPDIKRIMGLLPQGRQNLLFSATFADEIKRLCQEILQDPVHIQVARRNMAAETVSHVVHIVDERRKRDLLEHLLRSTDMKQVLVFSSTRLGASRLARQLTKDGINASEIHSNKTQGERTKALDEFKRGVVRVLVATDVAARGLDIDDLPHVINYDLPNNPEDYVHRIGRTGRAGASGEAISLATPAEREEVAAIERFLKLKLPIVAVEGFDGAARPRDDERPARSDAERRPRDAERRPRDSERRPRERQREEGEAPAERPRAPAAPPRPRPGADPLFSKPYEPAPPRAPGEVGVVVVDDAPEQIDRRSARPVAALFLPPRKQGTGS